MAYMFETDVIFNDIKSLITTEVSIEDNERGNMDYLFWIICDDNSIPKLKRFLSVYPSCIFSEPFESEELLKKIRESKKEQWMKFIGVDFKYMSLRRLLHFRENVLNIIGHGKSNFIIKWWADYDDRYKMRAGGNLKEFCSFILNLTKSETERRLADIRTDIVTMLSNRMFDNIKSLYLDDKFVDISKFTKDLLFCAVAENGCWINVYKDDSYSLIRSYMKCSLNRTDINGWFKIYKCVYEKLPSGRIMIVMILQNDHHGPSRILLRKYVDDFKSFFSITDFKEHNRINMSLIEDAAFERLFEFGKYARK